jgi:hypothetical protein
MEAGALSTHEEYQDFVDAMHTDGDIDAYMRKWSLPHYFHVPRAK